MFSMPKGPHHQKDRRFASFPHSLSRLLQKLLLTGKYVLMNEALIQSELLTAFGTRGTNSFAVQVRYVWINPRDLPDA